MASISDIKGLLDSQTATIQQSIKSLEVELKGIQTEVKEVKSTVAEHTTQIADMQAEVKRMKSGGSAGGGFAPSNIILKNFCDYKDKKLHGMSRPEAEALLEKLKTLTPASLQSMVGGLNALKGSKVYACSIAIKNPEYCKEIAAVWKESNLTFNGRAIWIHAERSDADQKRYATAGGFKAFCQSKVVDQATVECSYQPDFKITISKDDQFVQIATVSVAGERVTDETKISGAFGCDEKQFLKEFIAFKKQERQ